MSNPANLVHRGEAVGFRAHQRNEHYSTDAFGFRHSVFAGETLSVGEILNRPRYGTILGSSHIFGLGLSGNENTIPSLLGERVGIPFANVSLPEGNSRNLYALLAAQLARAPNPPEVVLLFNGGDFSSFCLTGLADPVFGSPNLKQLPALEKERDALPPPDQSYQQFLAFSTLWNVAIVQLCRAWRIPLVLGRDTSFFTKEGSTGFERECMLGTPCNDLQRRWFATHHKYGMDVFNARETFAARSGIPIAGPLPPTQLTYLDEFHYDEVGSRMVVDELAATVGRIVGRESAAQMRPASGLLGSA